MAKRPTWPCYYNDLRGSTLDWTDEEFGAYVRLLIFHFDKGYIPGEASRREKISDSANKHWALLSEKFISLENGNLTNKRADEIKDDIKKHSAKQKENIQKRYRKSYQTSTKSITDPIPLENENEIEIEDENKEGVTGETISENFIKGAGVLIVPEMLAVWMQQKPQYLSNPQNDFSPLREIAEMIAASKDITDITQLESVDKIKESFSKIVKFINTDGIYKDFQISQVAKYFNAITSKMRSAAKGVAAGKKPSIINNNISAANGARDILESKYGEVKA